MPDHRSKRFSSVGPSTRQSHGSARRPRRLAFRRDRPNACWENASTDRIQEEESRRCPLLLPTNPIERNACTRTDKLGNFNGRTYIEDNFNPDLLRESCQASFMQHHSCAIRSAHAPHMAPTQANLRCDAGRWWRLEVAFWSTNRPVGNGRLRGTLRHDHAHPSIVITRIGHHDQALEAPSG